MKFLNKKSAPVFLISLLLILFLVAKPHKSEQTNLKDVEEVLTKSLDSSFHSNRFLEPRVGLYGEKTISYITSTDNKSTSVSLDDAVFSSAIKLHEIDLCFMERVTTLDKNSKLYSNYKHSDYFTDYYFYTSCPVRVNNKLVGFVEVLIFIKPFGLLPNYNFVILAAHNVSIAFQEEFNLK